MAEEEALLKMDLYAYLNVKPEATKTELAKAYKKRAKKDHPDKNPDNPKAGEVFDRLKKIYSILEDVNKRAAYDKARQQQEIKKRKIEEADAGRQTLLKSLARREEEARLAKLNEHKMSETEKARTQTEILIQELAKQGHLNTPGALPTVSNPVPPPKSSSCFASSKKPCLFGASASPSSSSTTSFSTSSSSSSSSVSETVVISWKEKKGSDWKEELRKILEQFGAITDLIVLKKKALAVFACVSDAENAVKAHAEHPDLTFSFKQQLHSEQEADPPTRAPVRSPPAYVPPEPLRNDAQYEMQTLMRLKTAQHARTQVPEIAAN